MSAASLVVLNRQPEQALPVKKSNHQANIIRVAEILPHPDPETTSLELILIGGYQIVTRKGQFSVGDLGVYLQPDSVVPQTQPFRFIWNDYVGLDGTVPEKRRRITVRKFRKEWSEGLLLPISDFSREELMIDPNGRISEYLPAEGEDVSDRLGITHYDPDAGTESTKGESINAPKRKFRYPKTFRGWVSFLYRRFIRRDKNATRDVSFHLPTYDVEAFKNYKGTFVDGEIVVVTEKIHGSNARFVFLEGEMYAGSRTQWKAPGGSDVWNKALKQNPWIEQWCRAHEGYSLWGEVTPTQGKFDYGSSDVQFFLFDIRTPDGRWLDFEDYGVLGDLDLGLFNYKMVPVLYWGTFNLETILPLVDGKSEVIGAKHIREGVVIKTFKERSVRGLGRAQLKIVSSEFLLKDSK